MKNLSIRYKLLLGFIILAAFMLSANIVTIYNLNIVKNDFSNLAQVTPRMQALLEMRNLSNQVYALTSNYEYEKNLTYEQSNDIKNQLLALLEEMDIWQQTYKNNSINSTKSTSDISELQIMRDAVVLNAIDTFEKISGDINNAERKKYLSKLNSSVASLNVLIKNVMLNESFNADEMHNTTIQTTNNIFLATLALSVTAFILAIIFSLILTKIISDPIIRLKEFTNKIDLNHLSTQLSVVSDDEIGELATTINRMLSNLASAKSQLIESSRAAGASVVAISILHNVGNVLNSINTSVSMMEKTLKSKDFSKIGKVVNMFNDNLDNLTEYVKNNSHGKLLLPYLTEFDKSLYSFNNEMISELDRVQDWLEHINHVIATQQSIGKAEEVQESIELSSLIDEIVSMHDNRIKSEKIIVKKEYGELIVINIVKYKIQQVLINLIKNAIESFPPNYSNKKIIIKTYRMNGKIYIVVMDNGAGIDKELIKQIFAFGFTTKADGHGFGLHNSALLIKELGGKLTLESDGADQGTQSIIELPLNN